MTSSKSNRWLVALVVLVGWLVLPTSADAGRKRVVVLELEGPKAEKFHDDLVKLIKKTHTIIPVDKWNGIAEELDASSPNDKNIKKVAKKLKVDAVITGKIEKRRDEYIIQLKLREGKSGTMVGGRIDVKSEGPRIDGQASSDLKDELIAAIDGVASNRGGGSSEDEGDDEEKPAKKKPSKKDDDESADEEKPAKKGFGKKKDDEESADEEKPAKKKPSKKDDEESADEEKPAKKGFGKKKDEEADEEKPAKKGFGKKNDEETNASRMKKDDEEKPAKKKKEDEEEDSPLPKSKKVAKKDEESDEEDGEKKKPKKKVAKKDDEESDEEESVEASSGGGLAGSEALTPGERAVDVVLGLSFNARRMSFSYAPDLGNNPKPYKGVPVAGVLIDATVYPLAIGHKRHDMLKNIGLTVMYDKVIKINSKQGAVTLPTTQARYAFGAAFRYPVGEKFVVGASVRYGRQNFTISTVGGVSAEIPNVNYSILDPAIFAHYMATPKVILSVNLGFMAFLDTGAIQKNDSYGAATVTGFEGEIGGDYLLTKNIFARAAFRFESIGFKFKGSGAMTTGRDTDPEQDVFGASDKYLGGAVTVGYLY